ncbi:MAG: hypothetical protein JW780_03160 [Clostridiales bacterium]|nr:hypothetical protein [Clostridiales bacterium]
MIKKERCAGTELWSSGKSKSMFRHFSVLGLLVRSIFSAVGREEALRYSWSYLDEKGKGALGC